MLDAGSRATMGMLPSRQPRLAVPSPDLARRRAAGSDQPMSDDAGWGGQPDQPRPYGQPPGGYGPPPGGHGQPPGGHGPPPGGHGQPPGGDGQPPGGDGPAPGGYVQAPARGRAPPDAHPATAR